MRIASTINDSIVDGHGMRYTVFTQGCKHNCPGCHNPDTHDLNGGHEESVKELAKGLNNPLIEGLTLSGGEPFLQPEECLELAKIAHDIGKNVWVYTGYRLEELIQKGDPAELALLQEADVLVDGPFIEKQKSYELHFRGSRNQRLIDVQKTLVYEKLTLWEEEDPLAKFKVPES